MLSLLQTMCFIQIKFFWSMMTPRYLTDARHGISFPEILKFQSGSLLLYHNASHLSGENLRPSCIVLVSILFSAVGICLYNMSSPMGPPDWVPDHQRRRSFVLCYPGSVVVVDWSPCWLCKVVIQPHQHLASDA